MIINQGIVIVQPISLIVAFSAQKGDFVTFCAQVGFISHKLHGRIGRNCDIN